MRLSKEEADENLSRRRSIHDAEMSHGHRVFGRILSDRFPKLDFRKSKPGRRRNDPALFHPGIVGQREIECGAFAGFTLRPDFAAVALHDVFDDRKSEPGAALLAGTGFV